MQATRFRAGAVFAVFALCALAGSPGCGNESRSRPSCVSCGGEGGEGGARDLAGAAGDATSSSGSSTLLPQGGAPAGTSGAATSAAGTDSHGGQGGAANGGAAGGEAGGTTNGEQLDLCKRLDQGAQDADAVASAYVGAVYRDCRVSWVVPRGQALADLVNRLVAFSYNLWGCERTLPVDEFGLVLGTPALSQGDLDVLLDHYLTAAQDTLDLSRDERETLLAALLRLAKPLIMDPSLEPSKSVCSDNTGGAGGGGFGGAAAGGAAPGGADAGGADAGATGGASGAGGLP